jgi:two-component system, OmpR family, response regulator
MKVLVVEDDRETAAYIIDGLSKHKHVVDHADTGPKGLLLAESGLYGVAVVDRMLPGLDGLSLVKALRCNGVETPVLFLTNLCGIDDRVEGLDAGGDDYLTKPFVFVELLARVNALGRRSPTNVGETMLRVADLEVDLLRRRVVREGCVIDLQPREFKLLECLLENAGRIMTRTMLLEKVWDFHFDPKTKIVETHMSRLRSKIDRGFSRELIHTVRGAGYLLRATI